MFKIFVIFFREILEISAILGIIAAGTVGIKGRAKYIWSGVGIGIKGAIVVALIANYIFSLFGGYGQELMNASVLLLVIGTILWTIVWMQLYRRKLVTQIKDRTQQITINAIPLTSLTIITASLVFREGLEIVLFSYGVLTTTTESWVMLLTGATGGSGLAALIGFLIYKGAISLSSKHLFQATSIMLTLIAAGMAVEAANFLSASEIITVFQQQLWDSSWLISQNSSLGKMLHALIGYTATPNGTELIFYLTTLGLALILPRFIRRA